MKTFRHLLKQLNATLKDFFANYAVIDDCGTKQLTYTLKGAREWLPYCGKNAYICRAYSFSVLEGRSY